MPNAKLSFKIPIHSKEMKILSLISVAQASDSKAVR
jgi:hypothetical protein